MLFTVCMKTQFFLQLSPILIRITTLLGGSSNLETGWLASPLDIPVHHWAKSPSTNQFISRVVLPVDLYILLLSNDIPIEYPHKKLYPDSSIYPYNCLNIFHSIFLIYLNNIPHCNMMITLGGSKKMGSPKSWVLVQKNV